MRNKNYRLGCLKDPKDLRDLPMGLVLPPIPLPSKIDYAKQMTPVRDQGDEGTCVAFACVVGVKEYQDSKEFKKYIELSPRYLYNLCKKYDGIPGQEGTFPRIAMKVLFKYGVCKENCWPYKPHQRNYPCSTADTEAKTYRIKAYARLNTVLEMKRSLIVNGPFVSGVRVYSSWFTKRVFKTGLIPMPKKQDEYEGGHAICIVGYDEKKGIFKFKNSWGTKWGDEGYGYLPYDYIKKYSMDSWSSTDLILNPLALVKKREEVLTRYA